MTNPTDLIARLREGQKYDAESGYPIVMDYIMDEAADAIEAAQAEIEAVRKANIDCVHHFDALSIDYDQALTALAECRDAFPAPDAGSELDGWYVSAIADPLEVPEYVKACVGASPAQPSQAPEGFALVPIRATRAMEEVFEEEGWEWANLLAAAEAVTLEEYEQALEGAQPSQAGELSDTERLDFLDENKGSNVFSIVNNWYTRPGYGQHYKKRKSLRDAVDAAINAKESK